VCPRVCVGCGHNITGSLSASDLSADEDASCSNREAMYGHMSVPRVSLVESTDSTYNELGDEDPQ